MILQNEKCTAVIEIDEKFVLDCEDEKYDIIFNPCNVKRNEPHEAVKIIAKTEKTITVVIVVRHNEEIECGGFLNGEELTVTFEKNALTLDLKTGELLRYEKNAFSDEFDFSELDKMLE